MSGNNVALWPWVQIRAKLMARYAGELFQLQHAASRNTTLLPHGYGSLIDAELSGNVSLGHAMTCEQFAKERFHCW